jgi:hypothetical protein
MLAVSGTHSLTQQKPYLEMTYIGNIEVNGVLRGVYIQKTNDSGCPIEMPVDRLTSKKCLEAVDHLVKSLSYETQKNLQSIDCQGLKSIIRGSEHTTEWGVVSREFETWRNFIKILNPETDNRRLDVSLQLPNSP